MKTFATALAFASMLSSAMLTTACDGPPTPTPVKDEPVCTDFAFGPTKTMMHGGLKQPVLMRIKDGKTIVATTTVYGLPTTSSKPTLFLLPDANATYNVEWIQCPNERAPTEIKASSRAKGGKEEKTSYYCGVTDANKPYSVVKMTTKKGDGVSREVSVPTPPVADCWASSPGAGDAPDAPSATAAPETSAAPTAPPTPTALPTASAVASTDSSPGTTAVPGPSSSAAKPTVAAP